MATLPIILIYYLIALVPLSQGQSEGGRAPHGLSNEHPVAFSPSAFEFFHPSNRGDPCSSESACSPMPVAAAAVAATVSSSLAQESRSGTGGYVDGGAHVGIGPIVAVVLGCLLGIGVVVAAIGVYYVAVVKKRSSSSNVNNIIMSRNNSSVKPTDYV